MRGDSEGPATGPGCDTYRAVFDAVDEAILVLGLTAWPILDFNQACLNAFGYTAEELTGLALDALLPGDREHPPERLAERLGLAAQGEPQALEWPGRAREGRALWLALRIRRVQLDDGPRLLVVARDITARRQVEDHSEWLAGFPRESPEPIVGCDLTGQPIYLNPAAQELLRSLAVDLVDLLPVHHHDIVRACQHERARTEADSAVAGRAFAWTYQPVPGLGVVYLYGNDATARKRAEARLQESALADPLTGLPNRALLLDRLQRNADLLERHADYCFGVLWMDLDRFQVINETLGHAQGDLLLKEVGQRLRRCVKQADTVARPGGDEFVVLLEDIGTPGNATRIADRIRQSLAEPFALLGREVYVGASLGLTLAQRERHAPADLLRDAEAAMFRAKTAGRGRFLVFDPAMHARAEEQLALETDLRRALEAGNASAELVNFYQPIVSLGTGAIQACEALVRWRHPTRGLLGPMAFLPQAEEAGLMGALGELVLAQACRDLAAWRRAGHRGLRVSINLAADQFQRADLAEQVVAAAEAVGLPPEALELEITESMAAQDVEATVAGLARLREHGIQVMIDDFGTGYSSLAHLKRLPLDVLKIDRAFVTDVTTDPGSAAIVSTVILLAHALGCEVVAEGVETRAQLEHLRQNGCDFVQGYLFSRPVPAEDFARLLAVPGGLSPEVAGGPGSR
jgi:diguanylate cyclase (GGDEF)-like protein/PAS domain S-box-containing protein